jgi:hypothetical protein
MRAMLFTTINNNLAHRYLSVQSKRKGANCPHYLEDTYSVWQRKIKQIHIYGEYHFLNKKHAYRAMDCQFDGQKED